MLTDSRNEISSSSDISARKPHKEVWLKRGFCLTYILCKDKPKDTWSEMDTLAYIVALSGVDDILHGAAHFVQLSLQQLHFLFKGADLERPLKKGEPMDFRWQNNWQNLCRSRAL